MQKMIKNATMAAVAVMVPAAAQAALVAADNASDAAYSTGWKYGMNGGSGFQPWAGGTAGNSIGVIGKSTSTEYPAGTPIATAGKAWCFNPTGTNTFTFATRALTANDNSGPGSLDVGQSLSFDMDNGWGSGGSVGFRYLGSDGSVRFSFTAFNAYPTGNYAYGDATGSHSLGSGTANARAGVHTVFTLEADNTYSLSVTRNLATTPVTTTYSGTLSGTAGSGIVTITLFKAGDLEGWSLPNYQRDFNNLAVSEIPEPVSVALLGLAGLTMLRRGRTLA